MLPDDTKARRTQVLEENLRQTNVDDHFKPAPKEAKPDPYSDELFKEAAIEWLIETNQVCSRHIIQLHLYFHLLCSRFKRLIIRLSRRWSTSLLMQREASSCCLESKR